MYNTSFICSYMEKDESNEQYQKDLLAVFDLTSYSELTNCIQQLYSSLNYPIQDIVQYVSFQSNDPELLFLVLFSYDYFKYTHNLICKILTKQDTSKCHEELINILKKT